MPGVRRGKGVFGTGNCMYNGRQRKTPVVQGMAGDLGCLERRWGRPLWRGKFGPDGEGLEGHAKELRLKDSPGGRGVS